MILFILFLFMPYILQQIIGLKHIRYKMNNVTLLFIIFVIPFVYSQKVGGPFYIINEGFFPRSYSSDSLAYDSELKSMKNDYGDKRIHGKFQIKEKIQNISFTVQSWRESSTKLWLKCGSKDYPNLCNVTFSTKHFMKAFTGKLNSTDCSLTAGNYTLTNYTFESDLRETVGDNFFFGHYKYSITIGGISAGDKRNTVKFDMMMHIKNLEEKSGSGNRPMPGPGPAAGKNKNSDDNKISQNKNKSDNRNGKKN